MTKDEALKLALEALKDNQHLVADNERHAYVMEYNGIIEKCEEALAQPERPQNCGTGYCSCIECVMEPEPVALQMDVIVVNLVREGINKHRARELAEHFIKHISPPQRQWVGLTDDDLRQIILVAIGVAEAKLKEKNRG